MSVFRGFIVFLVLFSVVFLMLHASAFYVLLMVWLWVTNSLFLNQIARNNQARLQAERAYRAGQYAQALVYYEALNRSATPLDPAVRLNLGHTQFRLGQYDRAKPQYRALLESDRPDLRTVAATQLGVLACLERDSATALRLFEQALLEDPDNEPARYNFESVKQRYSGRPLAPKVAPSTSRQPKRVSKPEPTGGEQVERSERHDELLRRFRGLNISGEQALQLLDAMQQDDLPYALTRAARRPDSKPVTGGNRW